MILAIFLVGTGTLTLGCVGLGMEAYEAGFAAEQASFLGAAVWFGVTHVWAHVTGLRD